MNLEVFNPWTVSFWALMAGAVALLWRVGSSPTAKWGLVGAVLATVGAAIWGNLEARGLFNSYDNPDIQAFSDNTQCLNCRESESRSGYTLRSRWLNGEYSFSLTRDLPYALRYTQGAVTLDDRPLAVGCSSGTMPTSARMRFERARGVVLEVGEGAKC